MSVALGAVTGAFGSFVRILFTIVLVSLLFQTIPIRSDASDGKSNDSLAERTSAEVRLGEFRAEVVSDRTRLAWNTTFESDVLGFNLWREDNNGQDAVNKQLIAGSVVKVANGVLDAGDDYGFFDWKPQFGAAYWLEAVFLSGETLRFGPVFAETVSENNVMESSSKTIDDVPFESIWARAQSDKVDFPEFYKQSDTAVAWPSEVVSGESFAGDGSALKFDVKQTGWYRVPASVMQANGFPMGSANTWKMYFNGRETAIGVNADGSVEFFGTGIDTVQSDTGVYWLTFGSGNGKRVGRSTQKYNQSVPNGWTRIIAERRDKVMRLSGVVNGARENWFASYVSATETSTILNLNEIATESNESAIVGIDLQGIGAIAHNVAVVLNGTEIGRIAYNDFNRFEWTTPVPLSALRSGANEIKLRTVGSTNDYSLLEAVRINYPRRLTAQTNRLQFSLAARKTAKLRGFTSSRVRVFDVTNSESVNEINPATRLESDGTYSVTLSSSPNPRLFVAQGDGAAPLSVNAVAINNASQWRSATNQANFVMIAPARLHADLLTLKNARESIGLRTVIVDPTDIYDEFNNGIQSADAIRSFLQYARQNWTLKPDFALFVGDASVDPRNYSGTGGDQSNLVPTMFTDTWNIEAVTDTMLADFNGDNIEDIQIGRLPVRTSAELNAVVTKILGHDASTNEEILSRGALMISDAYVGYNFENGSRIIAQNMPSSSTVIYQDLSTNDPTVFRQSVLNSMNSGPAVVNYFGHASVTFWASQQIYRTSDAPGLTNYSRPSLGVMLACLNGTFAETYGDSLAEATIKSPNGGAFGIWASSAWNGAYEEEAMGREFYGRVYSGLTVGEAVRQTKALFQTVDLRRTFIYFGDPSQRLIR